MPSTLPIARRRFLQIAGSSALAAGSGCSGPKDAQAKPNVVLIVTDDHGYGDLGCHGNEIIHTPHLDRLHGESARFTDFHVDPLCSPTRAALLTGRYAFRAGVTAPVAGRSILRRDETTMAEVFAANGYRTGLFGKWHLGGNYPYRPNERGFEDTVVCWSGGVAETADAWGNDYFDDTYSRNNKPEKFEGYCTDVFFREATRFIETNREVPFFAYLPTNAPHGPYLVDDKYSRPYVEKGVSPRTAAFYGMIENLDENVGRLRQRLSELGLEENTILIFMTDNGTAAGYGRAAESDAWKGHNAGMRGIKGSKYDGGHRVPFFLRWPAGGIDQGRDIAPLAAHIDVLPTLMDLLALQPAKTLSLDGVSLVPLLRGEGKFPQDRVHFIQHQMFPVDGVYQYDQPRPWLNSAVLNKAWRLIDGRELYDIAKDPAQRNDVSAQNPEVATRLREAYLAWWAEVSGPATEYVPIVIGDDEENPAVLTCFDWHPNGGPNTHAAIREASRNTSFWSANGFWSLEVDRTGRYEITLRQQPPEAQFPIEGKVARLQVGDMIQEKPIPPQTQAVTFEVELAAGATRLQTWFEQQDGYVRGAYFAYVNRLS